MRRKLTKLSLQTSWYSSLTDLLVLRLIHWWRTHCRRGDALHVLLLTFWKLNNRFSYIPRMSLSSIRRFRALSGIFLFTKRAQYCWEGGVMLRLPRSRAACPAGRYTIRFNRSMMKSISLTLVQSGEPIVISQPRFIMIFSVPPLWWVPLPDLSVLTSF